MNLRPSGYEPDELPGCSTPRGSEIRGRRAEVRPGREAWPRLWEASRERADDGKVWGRRCAALPSDL